MIFLDANAFYSYFGRSKLNFYSSLVDEKRLRKYLEKKSEKSLPTSVFIEIMTHFRDNPLLLEEIVNFIKNKNLKLYNNIPDYVISTDELTCVGIMDGASLKEYANKLLKSKIEIESRFTLFFLEITKDLYARYKLESINELSQPNKDSILSWIGRTVFEEYGKLLEKEIKKELEKGYVDNKEQNILKKFYIQKLNEACTLIDMTIAGCINLENENIDIIDAIQNAYQKNIDLGMDGKNSTMFYIVDTLLSDKEFLNLARLKISEMFKKGGYSNFQRVYLRDVMFTAWFERGQKLKKNDIFDMLCIGCLDYKDTRKSSCILIDSSSYIITFDKKMKEFLGVVRPNNLKIIENI